jgi:hypothetical protein
VPQKLVCFVDESGQDTEGAFFVVVAIVAGSELPLIVATAAELERSGGKGVRKWNKSRMLMQRQFAEALTTTAVLKGHVYTRIYAEGKNYLDRTAYVVADALHDYMAVHYLDSARSVVTIDGLKEEEARQVNKVIRRHGLFVSRIRGARDESDSLIRLADGVAGPVRAAYTGDADFQHHVEILKRRGILIDI